MIIQEVKLGFGLDGVYCRLYSNSPCRSSKTRPNGVCEADRDAIAARNFLQSVAAGSGCYIHVVENAAKRLKEEALVGRGVKGRDTLHRGCGMLGIAGGLTSYALNPAHGLAPRPPCLSPRIPLPHYSFLGTWRYRGE